VPAPPRLRFKRAEPRLDPVRWRRPGRGTLIRMIAVAALLTVGAAAAWSRQPPCAPPSVDHAAPSNAPRPPRRSATGPMAGTPTPADPGAGTASTAAGPAARSSSVPTGRVGVPVRLAEPAALALVHPGDRVDLLRVDGSGRGTSPVAVGAPVLDVTGANDPTTGGLLLALRPGEAQSAVAGQGSGFAVLIRPD
jgi:hypothetical protein